jgi:serine O-acetyltransferase
VAALVGNRRSSIASRAHLMRKCRIFRLWELMHRLHRAGIPLLPDLARKYIRLVYACDLPCSVELGAGVCFPHNGLGVVVHERARIGDNCTIYQNVTIGGDGRGRARAAGAQSAPAIGNRVIIYAGAVVGGPITIGDGAIIGANAVVLESVPANTTVGGVPARVLKRRSPTLE